MATPMLGRSGTAQRASVRTSISGAPGPEARFSFHPPALIALIALLAHLKFGKPSAGMPSPYNERAYASLPPPRQDDQLSNLIILTIFVKQRTYLAPPPSAGSPNLKTDPKISNFTKWLNRLHTTRWGNLIPASLQREVHPTHCALDGERLHHPTT